MLSKVHLGPKEKVQRIKMTKKGCPDIQFSIFMLEPPEITSNLRFQRARACTLDHDKSTSKIQKLRNFNFLLILGSESKNMLYIVGGSILWVFGVLSIKYGPKSFGDCRNILMNHCDLRVFLHFYHTGSRARRWFVVWLRRDLPTPAALQDLLNNERQDGQRRLP